MSRSPLMDKEKGLGESYVDMNGTITEGCVYNLLMDLCCKLILTPQDAVAFLSASCVMIALSLKMCVL